MPYGRVAPFDTTRQRSRVAPLPREVITQLPCDRQCFRHASIHSQRTSETVTPDGVRRPNSRHLDRSPDHQITKSLTRSPDHQLSTSITRSPAHKIITFPFSATL